MKYYIFLICLLLLIMGCQKEENILISSPDETRMENHQFKTAYEAESLFTLLGLIEELYETGYLKKGTANALASKIRNAIKSIEKGNFNAAQGQLNAFIHQVKGLVKNTRLTADQGNELIEIVNKVLNPVGDDTFVDTRDGQTYPFVQIGEQVWMTKNLAYLPEVHGSNVQDFVDPLYYVYNNESDQVSMALANEHYDTYGVLYNWEAAKISCPEGWRLPQSCDWDALIEYLGAGVATELKATSGWYSDDWTNGNGDNSSGFSALPGGILWDGFNYIGQEAYFWTATGEPNNSMAADCYYLYFHLTDEVYNTFMDRKNGLSVRCIKGEATIIMPPSISTTDVEDITQTTALVGGQVDADGGATVTVRGLCWNRTGAPGLSDQSVIVGSGLGSFSATLTELDPETIYYVRAFATNACGTAYGEEKTFTTETETQGSGIFTDPRDLNEYAFITLGSQTWMAENLAFLPEVHASNNGSDIDPRYYVYGNETTSVNTVKQNPFYLKYGVLYNWPAAMNDPSGQPQATGHVQGICPVGWHLPADQEWGQLIDYLTNNGYGYEGSGADVGKSLASPLGWNLSGIQGAVGNDQTSNNQSGFEARPGGFRNYTGGYLGVGTHAYFWSSDAQSSSYTWYRLLHYNYGGVYRNYSSPKSGYYIRCLKD